MSPEEKVRLTHIVEAATLIASYINGIQGCVPEKPDASGRRYEKNSDHRRSS